MNTYIIRINYPEEEWLKKYDKNIQHKFANKIRKLKENPEFMESHYENRYMEHGTLF